VGQADVVVNFTGVTDDAPTSRSAQLSHSPVQNFGFWLRHPQAPFLFFSRAIAFGSVEP